MWQGRRVSVGGTKKKKKTQVRRVCGEEQRSSAALYSRWRRRLQVLAHNWRVRKCAKQIKFDCGLGILPHKGGLVSPTDRPTTNAMTASRINRANATMMYFCQMKMTLISKHIPRHAIMMYTSVGNLGGCPGETEKFLPFWIFSGISQLSWFLPLLY